MNNSTIKLDTAELHQSQLYILIIPIPVGNIPKPSILSCGIMGWDGHHPVRVVPAGNIPKLSILSCGTLGWDGGFGFTQWWWYQLETLLNRPSCPMVYMGYGRLGFTQWGWECFNSVFMWYKAIWDTWALSDVCIGNAGHPSTALGCLNKEKFKIVTTRCYYYCRIGQAL